jgi:hypothetical protein
MNRLAQILNRHLARLGVSGIAGLGILIACMGFYGSVIAPLQQHIVQRKQLFGERHIPMLALRKDEWRSLQSQLPPQMQVDELVANIYRLAEAAQIDLHEAEFKEERFDNTEVLVRHLNFLVGGNYFHVRQFLSSTLAEIPTLALEGLSFQKAGDGGETLEVRISMTLYAGR